MSPAERAAVARVVLCVGRKTGLAWPGYRFIARECGLSPKTISAALKKAVGRHLKLAGRGEHGVQKYRILPVEAGDSSVSPTEALDSALP
jgi:hypothetical protein